MANTTTMSCMRSASTVPRLGANPAPDSLDIAQPRYASPSLKNATELANQPMRMMAPHLRPPGTLALAERSRPAVRDMSRHRIPRNQKLRKYRTSAAVYMSGSIDDTLFHNSSQSMLKTRNSVRNSRAPATKVTAIVGSENTRRLSASPLSCLSGGFVTTGSPPLVV